MEELSRGTPVTIFGRTYHLRGHHDPSYLERLAALVDEKMKEVAQATGAADTVKIAILAALNLADERLQAEAGSPGDARGAAAAAVPRLERLVSRLDELLAEP